MYRICGINSSPIQEHQHEIMLTH